MTSKYRSHILFGLKQILSAVAGFCLRHSIRLQDLWEIQKEAFVDLAKAEIVKNGEKITTSRVSVMTGLHRREVMKLIDNHEAFSIADSSDLITRVVGQWQNDPEFCTKSGVPKILSYGEIESEFYKLVGKVSNDMNPATVLFELIRTNAVEKTPTGVKLIRSSYSPKSDPERGFKILRADIEDILHAVEENIFVEESTNLHARTEFDNLSNADAQRLKKWVHEQGHIFHEKLRSELAKYDRDFKTDKHSVIKNADKELNRQEDDENDRARIVVTAFSRVEEMKEKVTKKRFEKGEK